ASLAPTAFRSMDRLREPNRIRAAGDQSAGHLGEDFDQAPLQEPDHLVDLFTGGDQRRAEGDPVGIEAAQEPILKRPSPDAHAEGGSGGERLPGCAVADELDGLEQALAADIADD